MVVEKQFDQALIEEIRRSVNQRFGKSRLDIDHIQYVAKLYFDSIIKSKDLLSIYTAMPLCFTNEDCKWITNIAVAHFLEYWLENDSNARQGMYSFTQSPFKCMDEIDTDKLARADYDMRIQLGRARKKYCKLQKRRNEQITDDEFYAFVDDEHQTLKRSKDQKTYNFIELCWFDMWSNNKQLLLLDFISFGFQPDTHYTDDWWFKNLQSAYPNYYANLERINSLSISRDINIEDHFNPYVLRQYVTSCMVIRKIEQSNRFSLISTIAQKKNIVSNDFRKDLYYSAIYWGRYPASENRIIKFDNEKLVGRMIEDQPLDVGNYEEAIKVVFGASTIEKDLSVEKHRVLRAILLDIIHILYALYPIGMLPHWRNMDFSKAAFFYRKQYPFIEDFLRCSVPANDKEFYLNCKKQFQELVKVENSQFKKIIYMNADDKLNT